MQHVSGGVLAAYSQPSASAHWSQESTRVWVISACVQPSLSRDHHIDEPGQPGLVKQQRIDMSCGTMMTLATASSGLASREAKYGPFAPTSLLHDPGPKAVTTFTHPSTQIVLGLSPHGGRRALRKGSPLRPATCRPSFPRRVEYQETVPHKHRASYWGLRSSMAPAPVDVSTTIDISTAGA